MDGECVKCSQVGNWCKCGEIAVDDIDTEFTDEPVCPSCGCKDVEWWDCSDARKDKEAWDSECGNCGKKYRVVCHKAITFSTSEL
jgi:hypothetical protein